MALPPPSSPSRRPRALEASSTPASICDMGAWLRDDDRRHRIDLKPVY